MSCGACEWPADSSRISIAMLRCVEEKQQILSEVAADNMSCRPFFLKDPIRAATGNQRSAMTRAQG